MFVFISLLPCFNIYQFMFISFRDNVSWDAEQEAAARLKVENNMRTKVSEAQQSMCVCVCVCLFVCVCVS